MGSKRNNPMYILFCSKANSFYNIGELYYLNPGSGLLGCNAINLMNRLIYKYFEVILCSNFEV